MNERGGGRPRGEAAVYLHPSWLGGCRNGICRRTDLDADDMGPECKVQPEWRQEIPGILSN